MTTGEGGAIITDDDSNAETCRALRNHGNLEQAGLNYRMSDIHASVGNVQLSKLSDISSRRARLLKLYVERLAGNDDFKLPGYLTMGEERKSSRFCLQTLMLTLSGDLDCDRIMASLSEKGIETAIGSVAAHRLPAFRVESGVDEDNCPVATALARSGLALPFHPSMSEADVQYCVDCLLEVINEQKETATVAAYG